MDMLIGVTLRHMLSIAWMPSFMKKLIYRHFAQPSSKVGDVMSDSRTPKDLSKMNSSQYRGEQLASVGSSRNLLS
jgi:hypothetical protein